MGIGAAPSIKTLGRTVILEGSDFLLLQLGKWANRERAKKHNMVDRKGGIFTKFTNV